MEIIWIVTGASLIIAGFIGSFIPVIPGPPLSYIGLLFLQLTNEPPFEASFLIILALIVIIITVTDNLIPAFGAKSSGGSPLGVAGCIVGLIIGLIFFPPLGIVIGPVSGAFVGELIAGKTTDKAFRAAMGSFLGYVVAVLIKVSACALMGYYFFVNL